MNLINNKMIQKSILFSLINGHIGDIVNFPLPIYKEFSLKIEESSFFNELMKILNDDYILVEEIILDIRSEYIEFIIDKLIDEEIIKINLD